MRFRPWLVLSALAITATVVVACTAPDPIDPTDRGAAVPFETELHDAEAMIAAASAVADPPTAPVHRNVDGGNVAGAPDASIQRRDITVQWVAPGPPPFDAIRDRWTSDFGFAVTEQSSDDVFLAKGEMRASISQGAPAADGSRTVWFGVLTGPHPAAEVPEPT